MKLPKTLIIAGKTYRIIADKEKNGAHFDCSAQTITVGTEYTKEQMWAILLHEVAEIVLTDRDLRYRRNYVSQENGDLLFVFNHEQFDQAVIDIAFALKPFLKE